MGQSSTHHAIQYPENITGEHATCEFTYERSDEVIMASPLSHPLRIRPSRLLNCIVIIKVNNCRIINKQCSGTCVSIHNLAKIAIAGNKNI